MRTHPILYLLVVLAVPSCDEPVVPPASGQGAVSITTTSTGLDIDFDGYRVVVDGTDRGPVAANDSVVRLTDPGSRTISLAGVAANCTMEGAPSHTVNVADNRITFIKFAVVCTASTGVIQVYVTASGTDADGPYRVRVDGARESPVERFSPTYIPSVRAGDHVVSLFSPDNCSAESAEQSVALTAGELTRDTAVVTFPVSCLKNEGTLRIVAPTSGPPPAADYSVWNCGGWYDYYCSFELLGSLAPNDTLVIGLAPGQYSLGLQDIPGNCLAGAAIPSSEVTLVFGDTLGVELPVDCSPE